MPHFELRTYEVPEGRFADLVERFRSETWKYFERHRIEVLGFWQPVVDGRPHEGELVYLTRFATPEAAHEAWAGLRSDPEWLEVRRRTEVNGSLTGTVSTVTWRDIPELGAYASARI